MKVEPNFPDDVIVLVKYRNVFSWYVSEKELWIMDLLMLDNAFRKKEGLPDIKSTEAQDERKGFELLDEENIQLFQEVIKSYQVSFIELEEYHNLYSEVYLDNAKLDVSPSFYLDFDDHIFHSFFLEPGSYEEYIPGNWKGILRTNPNDYIPKEAKL